MKGLSIYILDDDPASLSVLTEMIGVGYPGADVYPHTDHQALLNEPDLCAGDLFIVDIRLNNLDGRALPEMVPAACRLRPFLFVSGYPLDDIDFDRLEGLVVFDFIGKPFSLRHFLHRIGILMNSSPAPTYPIDDVFDLMVYAPFVAVVLNDQFIVKYCNRQTATLLEVDTAAQIVGRTWLDFVPPADTAALGQVHRALMAGDVRHFGEYTNPVITAGGNLKRVKWFNTPFEGAEGEALTLSIGVPSSTESTVLDKIRRLWGDRIQADKARIRAVKPLASTQTDTCELPH